MFSTKYKVAFSDTDPGGIVFFAELFKIAHIGYERLFESLNLQRNYFMNEDFIVPIVNSSADFFSPVKFGDELDCFVFVEAIGTTSFTLKYKLQVGDQLKTEITTKHVVVKKSDFKKTDIPAELLVKLQEHL